MRYHTIVLFPTFGVCPLPAPRVEFKNCYIKIKFARSLKYTTTKRMEMCTKFTNVGGGGVEVTSQPLTIFEPSFCKGRRKTNNFDDSFFSYNQDFQNSVSHYRHFSYFSEGCLNPSSLGLIFEFS